jgi:hypothetical protein
MHIDDDEKNNRPENLRWGTQKENLNTPRFIAYCHSRVGDNSPWRKGMARKLASGILALTLFTLAACTHGGPVGSTGCSYSQAKQGATGPVGGCE